MHAFNAKTPQRLQHAKAVYTALHNQSSLHLLGSEKVLRGVKTWTTSHHTSLVLLYGHQGMGTKACFKHLIEHHQKLGWEIHLGYTVPPVSEKKKDAGCIWSSRETVFFLL